MPVWVRRTLPTPSPLHNQRQVILDAFRLIGGPEPRSLLEALNNRDSEVRTVAALLVPDGENDPGIIRALARALQSSDRFLSTSAFWALQRCGPNRNLIVADLTRMLAPSADPTNRDLPGSATILLGLTGSDAAAALPVLRARSTDPNPGMQVEAALAIWRIAHDDTMVRRMIEQLAQTHDALFASRALSCLGEMGQTAAPAIPTILVLLNRSGGLSGAASVNLRTYAVHALSRIDPSVAVRLLSEDLKAAALRGQSEDFNRCQSLFRELAGFGPSAAPALPTLRTLADDPGPAWTAYERTNLAAAAAAAIERIAPGR